jgi:hypothetical protein
MKYEKIDDKARVWILMRGPEGGLEEQLDPQYLSSLGAAHTAEEIADDHVRSAGEMELAETRDW